MAESTAGGGMLLGRQEELGVVAHFVEELAARKTRHLAAALLIQGPAGIGKTAVWLTAVEEARAAGIRVLTARPAEAEATFAYAALADLFRDVLPELLPRLPRPQRGALEVALGIADESDGLAESPLIQAAATNALLLLASEAPVLLAVDDAPWLDAPSAAVLQFLARRIGDRPLGFLLARRLDEDAPAPLGLDNAQPLRPVERLWLEPLSIPALHRLLAERLGMTLPRPLLIRLHELSRGVPFHALEIARALQGKSLPPPGAPLPIPASLRELLAERLRKVGEPARDALLLVAAGGALELATLQRVLGREAAEEAIGVSIDEGLLSLEGTSVRAAHPLIASTAYEVASARQRRSAHARLAELTHEEEARARHRALAATGPDEPTAAALEAAARQARSRGAPETAAELLRLALERTPADEAAPLDRRSLALAEALHAADDLPAAAEILDALIGRLRTGRLLAEARILRAEARWYTATSADAVRELEAGLPAAEGHPDLQAQMHYRLAIFYDYDLGRALLHARRAEALLADISSSVLLAPVLMQLFFGEVWAGQLPRVDLLERGLAIEQADTSEGTTIPGIWWLALDRPVEARRRFETLLERDRQRGDLSGEADLLTKLAEVELYSDRYGAARELADAATATARQHGDDTADPARRIRALVDVHEGKLAEARAVAESAARRAEAAGDRIIAVAWLVVLTLAAASERDHEAVVRYASQSEARLSEIGVLEPLRLSVAHELPEALVALGRLEEAESALDRLVERQERLPRPWLEAAIVRAQAEVLAARGRLDEAAAASAGASSEAVQAWRRFDRARTLLVRGAILRRARARREAAAALDEATAIFDEIGATLWAARARREAERLGRNRPGGEELTPSEEQVARLAASGLTNREVAERLSVSPKTVEAHLARAYAKLGISSRAELGRLMGEPISS